MKIKNKIQKKIFFVIGILTAFSCSNNIESYNSAIIKSEFIYEISDAQTPQCHASTIAVSGKNIVASWFGGTHEKNPDVGIWVAIKENDNWSKPVEVVNGVQKDGSRFPCWNPVLFQPKNGPLFLFYKVGPSPREWWGLYLTSTDNGKHWSEPVLLPKEIYGPIKNKPVQLENGLILSPTSTEHDGWKIQIEKSSDLGKTWSTSGDLNDGKEFGAIQPTILIHQNNKIQLLCRTENEVISQVWSNDNGKTWDKMRSLNLPNPNSGIDAVTLKDGRHLLVYNPTTKNWGDRVPLSIAISNDGITWNKILDLEKVSDAKNTDKEEYSYPSVIQANDGKVHIVYTWNRKTVKYVLLDPEKI
ncbi:MAG: exo-alpha-sialidase [Ignavibacteriae bacterium]|nr:exo-alpha-sialidase [Ignavibacteriota bacterium]